MERSAAEEGKIQGLFTLEREREREKLGQINARLTSVPANLLAELSEGKKVGRVSTCWEIGRREG